MYSKLYIHYIINPLIDCMVGYESPVSSRHILQVMVGILDIL